MKNKEVPSVEEIVESMDVWGDQFRSPKNEDRFSLKVTISGAMPSQRYLFDLEINENANSKASLDCVLSKRKKSNTMDFSAKEIDEIKEFVRKSRIFDFTQPPPRFLPDTLVGKLEIRFGKLHHVQYFIADENQARSQYIPTHPALRELLDLLYNLSAKMLKIKSVKP